MKPAKERLRALIRSAVGAMDRFWDSDDGDTTDLAPAMGQLREEWASLLTRALLDAYQRGLTAGFERGLEEGQKRK